MDAKAEMTKTDEMGEKVLHCKRCWKRRGHWRRVSGGMEIFKCKKCGSEQSYKLVEVATVEELKEAAKEARREKRQAKKDQELLAQETAERIATGLVMKNRDTWWRLICELSYNSGAKREENDLWNLQVAVGMAIVDKHLPYNPLDMVERMNELLKKCGLEPLGEMTAARLQEIASRELAERGIL
jgi:hypothetical protein